MNGLVKAQARWRGIEGRKYYAEVRSNHYAVIIQRYVRGFVLRYVVWLHLFVKSV